MREEILALIRSLPGAHDYIYTDGEKFYVTQEWLCGTFAGRSFCSEISLDEAAQELIDYLYEHINHDSIVGRCVTESGFPDLKSVKQYCLKYANYDTE